MAVTVMGGGTGQTSATLNLSTGDVTAILGSVASSPIVYPTVPAVPLVSATLTAPISSSPTIIIGSGLGAQATTLLTQGADTVTGSTSPASASIAVGSLTTAVTGTDTIGLNMLSATGPIGFLSGSGSAASVAGSSGTTTITGAGATVALGTAPGATSISGSNETLTGGLGPTTFNLSIDTTPGSGTGVTDTIAHFTGQDILNLGGSAANNQALSTYHVTNGSGSFSLGDGTKVVLQGYSGPLSTTNLAH